jgi:hypothetical protein
MDITEAAEALTAGKKVRRKPWGNTRGGVSLKADGSRVYAYYHDCERALTLWHPTLDDLTGQDYEAL